MMSEWKEYKLGDLVTFQRGHDLPRTEMIEGIFPVAGSNSIIGFHNKFTTKSPGITIGRSGNIGNPQLHKTDFWAHNTVLYVKEFKKVDPGYFYYLLKTLDFTQLNSGSAVPSLNRNFIHPFVVSIPESIKTQTAIAEILSSLDDKIELNNNINKELENLAQTLFKQWFIDFEFPNENGEPYQSSGGEMVESEQGMIPKDWEIGILDDILEVKGGTTPSTKDASFWDGIYHWTSPRDLSNLEFPLLIDTDKKITAKGLKKISSGLLPKGTLLLSSRAPIGYLAITEIETAINQGYIAINGKKEFSNIFILYWLKVNMHLVIERANGSTFLEISKTNFKQINCIIPDSTILHQYINQANATFEVMRNNLLENQELSTLRDTLLPKLISGELNVKDL